MTRLVAPLLAALALGLAGCNSGGFSRVNQTQVVLTSNNYRVVETGLKGSDTGFRVLGIGFSPQYSKAMQKLRILAELDDRPRALINIATDNNTWNYGIVMGGDIVITADVIEFTGPPGGH